ncbi:MAG: HAD family hydrolase [Candidatus Bathyarchaeia archaeon]
MIRTVLMDFDGTLHDWDSVIIRSLDGILGLRGGELYHIYLYEIHRGIVHARHPERHDDILFHCRLLFQHLRRPFDPGVAELIRRRFDEAAERARRHPIYFPDAVPALERMRGMGLKLCLSTGRDAEEKAETMERLGGTRLFDHAFSEASIGCLKTEPAYYRIALERAGSRPEEAVSVGDTPMSDIRPAKALGIRTIWVNRRGEERPRDGRLRADHEVHDLLEAADLLVGAI